MLVILIVKTKNNLLNRCSAAIQRLLPEFRYYLILSQSNLAGPGPGFFHWEGISEVR